MTAATKAVLVALFKGDNTITTEQPALFHFCGECRRMRPGSTMFRCDHSDCGPEWESLVFPDTEACRDFLPGESRFRVGPHGLIEKVPAAK